MTIVVAIHDGTTTWLGSDRLFRGSGSDRTILGTPTAKWVMDHRWAIATSGATFKRAALEDRWQDIFSRGEFERLSPFARGQILANALRLSGIVPTIDDDLRVPIWGSDFIVACAGEVWEYDEAMTPRQIGPHELVVSGSGSAHALAAAWAIQNRTTAVSASPEFVVRVAIEAACALDTSCEGPWLGKLTK